MSDEYRHSAYFTAAKSPGTKTNLLRSDGWLYAWTYDRYLSENDFLNVTGYSGAKLDPHQRFKKDIDGVPNNAPAAYANATFVGAWRLPPEVADWEFLILLDDMGIQRVHDYGWFCVPGTLDEKCAFIDDVVRSIWQPRVRNLKVAEVAHEFWAWVRYPMK